MSWPGVPRPQWGPRSDAIFPELLPLMESGNFKILVVGDSISEGWSASEPDRRWIHLLQEALRDKFPVTDNEAIGYLPAHRPGTYQDGVFVTDFGEGITPDLVGNAIGKTNAGPGFRSLQLGQAVGEISWIWHDGTGGTFTITFPAGSTDPADTTTDLPWDATGDEVMDAMNLLPDIGGDIVAITAVDGIFDPLFPNPSRHWYPIWDVARGNITPGTVDGSGLTSDSAGFVNPSRVLCVGDSLTEGFLASSQEATWHKLIEDMLAGASQRPAYQAGLWSTNAFAEPTYGGAPVDTATGIGRRAIGMFYGDSVTFEDVAGDEATLWLSTGNGSGAVYIAIDGAVAPLDGYLDCLGVDSQQVVATVTNANTATASYELGWWAEANDWTPSAQKSLGGWQDKVRLELLTSGKLRATVNDGLGHFADTTSAVGWTDGTGRWVKVLINIVADTVSFYHSTDPYTTPLGSVSWTLIETKALSSGTGAATSTVTACLAAFSTVSPTQGWAGKIRHFWGKIDGTAAFEIDFTAKLNDAWYFSGADDIRFFGFEATGARVVSTSDRIWIDSNDPDTSGFTLRQVALDLVDDGPHTVEVGFDARGAGTFWATFVSGLEYLPSVPYRVLNAGKAGYKATDYLAGFGETLLPSMCSEFDPEVVFIEFGANERAAQQALVDFEAALRDMRDLIRDSCNARIVPIICHHMENDSDPIPWLDYVGVINDVADSYGWDVVDFSDLPQVGTPEGDATGYYADSIHLTDAGEQVWADRIFEETPVPGGAVAHWVTWSQGGIAGTATWNDLDADMLDVWLRYSAFVNGVTVAVDGTDVASFGAASAGGDHDSNGHYVYLGPGTHDVEIRENDTGGFPSQVSGINAWKGDGPTGGYMRIDANEWISAGDSAAFDVTTSIEVVCYCALDDWTSGAIQSLVNKYDNFSGNQRSWRFQVNADGTLGWVWSTDGATATTVSSTAPGLVNGEWKYLRVVFTLSNRVAAFSVSDDGVSWTAISSSTPGAATTIFNSTAGLHVSSITSGAPLPPTGNFRYVEVTIDGNVVANPDFRVGRQRNPDAAGNTWTTTGSVEFDAGLTDPFGIHVIDAARGGATTGLMAQGGTGVSSSKTDLADWVEGFDPDLITLALCVNDWAQHKTIEEVTTNLRLIVEGLRDGKPDVPIAVIPWFEPHPAYHYSGTIDYSEYVDAQLQLLFEYENVRLINFYKDPEGTGYENNASWRPADVPGGILDTNIGFGLHPGNTGSQQIADKLFDAIVGTEEGTLYLPYRWKNRLGRGSEGVTLVPLLSTEDGDYLVTEDNDLIQVEG